MRKRRLEYDFYDRNQTCKLIVDAGADAVRVVIVTGARLYAQSYPHTVCSVERDAVRVEGNRFSAYAVQCDLRVDGLRVECAFTLGDCVAMPMSFGTVAGMRVSRYALDVPSVRACVNGFFILGGQSWERAQAAVQIFDGEQGEFVHTALTAIGECNALFVTVGANSTMGAKWNYARACFVTPERTFMLGSPTHVTRFQQGVTDMVCELKTPAVTLAVKLEGFSSVCDTDGTSICDRARATVDITTSFGASLSGQCSIPAIMTSHAARPCGATEKQTKSIPADATERLADCSQD